MSGDGLVDGTGLNFIIDNWGTGTPPGGNVPEPGTAVVFALGGLALLRRRRTA